VNGGGIDEDHRHDLGCCASRNFSGSRNSRRDRATVSLSPQLVDREASVRLNVLLLVTYGPASLVDPRQLRASGGGRVRSGCDHELLRPDLTKVAGLRVSPA